MLGVLCSVDKTFLVFTYIWHHRRQFFVDLANSKGAKCFCEVCLNYMILYQPGILGADLKKRSLPQTGSISAQNFWILPPNSGEYQNKEVFAAFWFYLSLEFWISCCQVSITCQKIEGVRHILPPSVSDLTGCHPLASRNRRQCLA